MLGGHLDLQSEKKTTTCLPPLLEAKGKANDEFGTHGSGNVF